MNARILPGPARAGLPATDAEVEDFEKRLTLGKWNSPDPEMLRTETRRLGRAVLARLRVAEARLREDAPDRLLAHAGEQEA